MRIKEAYIVIERGRIKRIGREPYGEGSGYQLNCEGLVVSPGYIDTHIHGLEGIDVLEATCDDILELGYKLVEHGVTSFLPTVAAAPHEDLLRVCRTVREAHESWNYKRGARVLGLYLEGPYVNPVKRGGQDERFIRGPSIKELEDYIRASGGLVRQITIAPELEGALDLISYASSRGIVVCIGHTMATYDETMLAIAAGARKATHIFNTMRSFHHREPGVALALLLSPSTFIEVNADFVHLHPATVRFAISLAGPDRVVLITDTSKVARLPDGEYVVRGMRIIV
ncbi:MAG: N-acetylglucosamine-6-phosphate deacetylase, partial [Thermoprotei archaeon]